MPLSASSFRNPLGNGSSTAAIDGDGYYVAFGFDQPNAAIGGSFHLGADWNGESGGNSDLGDPVYSIANATVISVVSDQGAATTGFGNYIVLRHDLPELELINGQWVDHVHSLFAHLESVEAISVGQQIAIGQQIGTVGMSGNADVAHLHLEITLGDTVPTSDDGYNPSGAPSAWVDPVSFVAARSQAASTPVAAQNPELDLLTAAKFSLAAYALAGNETSNDLVNAPASTQYLELQDGGWTFLTSAEPELSTLNSGGDGENAGYFIVGNAAALVAVKGSALVLSFRGTNDTELYGPDHADWLFRSNHFEDFSDDFLDQLRAYLTNHSEITDVLITGHSLGAAMVDALLTSSWDLRTVRPGELTVAGINFADPGYQLGIYSGEASSDLTTLNFQQDVINMGTTFSTLAGDFNRIYTADSGTSHAEYHTMAGYLSFVSYISNLGVTVEQLNSFDGRIFVDGSVAPSGLAFLESSYGSSLVSNNNVNNLVIGGSGNDTITGGQFGDWLIGGSGLDVLNGGAGGDFLQGSDGNDILYGDGGDDTLWGGANTDTLFGGSGDDTLYGGAGTDRLIGGSDEDVFLFAEWDFPLFQSVNPDRITDYNRGNTGSLTLSEGDLIDLSNFHFATTTGFGTDSTVRLRSVEASGGLPAGAILEVNTGSGIWLAIARLDGVESGQSVLIALTDDQSTSRYGTEFVVDSVGDGTTWSVSSSSPTVTEGDVTITFTIKRSGTSLDAETVYLSTTQTEGSYNDGDYVGRANVAVSFAAGDTSETFTVQINADVLAESNETFGVIVQSDPNDPISTPLASTTFTIEDGALPSVSGEIYYGNNSNNVWVGTSGNDLAYGYDGNDRLEGNAGDDTLIGGENSDTLIGGTGNDVIVTGNGGISVDAGSGNDIVDARQVGYSSGYISGGPDDDIIFVGSSRGGSDSLLEVDGESGVDILIAQVSGSGSYGVQYTIGSLRHRFGEDASVLSAGSNMSDIETAMATGELHFISTAHITYRNTITAYSWVSVENIERIEYRGGDRGNLFLDWGGNMTAALGGTANDTLYADWSTATTDIIWNLTVDNDTRKTLSNGVDVQSIERVLLKTGSGNDQLVLRAFDNHVETGAGNDIIDASRGLNLVDAGSGNDYIDARHDSQAQGTILGGSGNDTVIAGSGIRSGSDAVLNVNGGGGTDFLIVEARDSDGAYPSKSQAQIMHRFGSAGLVLGTYSELSDIEKAISGGGVHHVSSGTFNWYGDYSYSWIATENFEQMEYRGGDRDDLFLDWGGNMTAALGGTASDTVYADWSTATTDIIWNLTVDNDTRKTLSNGVDVQSIERVLLKTGSGNDHLVLGGYNDHVETGAGNDTIVTGKGLNFVDAGSGNDYIDARQDSYAQGTILGGAGNDTIIAGSANPGGSNDILTVDGGAGSDLLIVEGRDADSGPYPGRSTAEITHRFGSAGTVLNASSSLTEIEVEIGSGSTHHVSSARYNHSASTVYGSWISVQNIERIEYRGGDQSSLFLDWGGNMTAALGGTASDTVYADWSTATTDIIWNLTVDNDTRKTLSNDVDVQSIERVLLKTGSGNDHLVLGGYSDHVETGAGNDTIVTGKGLNFVDAGSGNDYIDARQDSYAQGTILGGAGNDTIIAGSANPGGSNVILTVDGGAGSDLLIVEGRDADSGSYPGRSTAEITHRFGSAGTVLNASSSFADVETEIASGATHHVSSARYNHSSSTVYGSWIAAESIEQIEYRGGDQASLFLDWGGNMTAALGGAGTDVLYANWSSATTDIVWNLTVDNDTRKTLSNGVDVQSIERVLLRTGSGNDQLVLGAQNDHVETGAGNDTVFGNTGNDTLSGMSGNDFLSGENGNDHLLGGDGYDTLLGGAGADALNGGNGLDRAQYTDATAGVLADLQFSSLNTGIAAGDTYVSIERLYGSAFNDNLRGDASANILWGHNGNDKLYGRDGNDTLLGGAGADALNGGSGLDRAQYTDATAGVLADLQFSSLNTGIAAGDTYVSIERLYGSAFNDNLRGDASANILWGHNGNDKLFGRGGNDTLSGMNGNDILYGQNGNDSLYGGAGYDTLLGGAGADTLNGGSGLDRAQYTDATAGVLADLQFSSLNTGIATGDTYVSIERLYGSAFNDNLRGDASANILWGHNGNDKLYGRDGNDTLSGMNGNDVLWGQNGSDQLSGGAGSDAFVFQNGFGQDTITDFNPLQSGEIIVLTQVSSITNFTDLSGNHLSQSGNNVIIDDGQGNTITLLRVEMADLTADDFLF